MAVKTIKLDKNNNYLLNPETGEVVDQYNPNTKLSLILHLDDGSVLEVDHSQIREEYGQIVVNCNKDKYIIDDSYQNTLVKAGYIVYRNYDIDKVDNKEYGFLLRSQINKAILEALEEMLPTYNLIFGGNYTINTGVNSINIIIGSSETPLEFNINIDSPNNIIYKNLDRKDKSLPFYPFDKNMDIYGTLYLSIFAKKNQPGSNTLKFELPNDFVADLMNRLGSDFKFVSLFIKKRLVYYEE